MTALYAIAFWIPILAFGIVLPVCIAKIAWYSRSAPLRVFADQLETEE